MFFPDTFPAGGRKTEGPAGAADGQFAPANVRAAFESWHRGGRLDVASAAIDTMRAFWTEVKSRTVIN